MGYQFYSAKNNERKKRRSKSYRLHFTLSTTSLARKFFILSGMMNPLHLTPLSCAVKGNIIRCNARANLFNLQILETKTIGQWRCPTNTNEPGHKLVLNWIWGVGRDGAGGIGMLRILEGQGKATHWTNVWDSRFCQPIIKRWSKSPTVSTKVYYRHVLLLEARFSNE